MVSEENLRRGFERQWMATPRLKLTRDASGRVTGAKSLLAALDDMDPFNAAYQVTLALLPEAVRRVRTLSSAQEQRENRITTSGRANTGSAVAGDRCCQRSAILPAGRRAPRAAE